MLSKTKKPRSARKPEAKRAQTKAKSYKPVAARSTPYAAKMSGERYLSNRELVGSISSAGAGFLALGASANTPGYDFNPGNTVLFPWLSVQALGWEKFRFQKLKFEIVPGNPSTFAGRIYAMIDYDFDDEVPDNFIQLAQTYGLVSSDVWQPFCLEADVKRMNSDMPMRYVNNNTRVEAEPRTAYAGFLYLATNGCTSTCTFDLYVSYEVMLSTPQAVSDPGYNAISATLAPLDTVPAVTEIYPVGLSNVPSGGARIVVPGAGQVPILEVVPTSWAGKGVIDVRDNFGGIIDIAMQVRDNVSTPAATVVGTGIEGGLFNANGNWIGWLSNYLGVGVPMAADTIAHWLTAGAIIGSSARAHLSTIRSALPTLAYIALGLKNTVAKMGETGNTVFGTARITKHEL